ncbi:glycoside hydrolase family 3 N-terminal domain-containing protein [Mitsuokella sp.]|uniref:glycoside hydrolase family 3 N-terminal domain-containing protein n=1 Tax=Mitsuokella sp. TaxID=2049034 RepID=UPI003D7C7592
MMKWKKSLALLTAALCFLSLGCGSSAQQSAAPKEKTLDEQVDEIVDSMTTTEKVGQMVMIGIQGTEVSDDSLYMLHQYHMGGVILFDRNMKSAEQTQKLISDLQGQAEQKVPLFIGVDEEGGPVVRGKDFIKPPASEQAIGQTGKVPRAEESARQTGEQLKKLGFNVNFAPVADVGNYKRSFSPDAEQAAKFVQAATQGYEEAHMMYALKHFPGIGRGTVDSHDDISAINASKEDLLAKDIVPFKSIIEQRQPEDYFILVSHLKYPALDAQNPASLSKAIQTDFLRGELGYHGLIITDDVEMGALAKHYSFRELGVRAVEAGSDIVLVCHEYPHETDVYLGLLDAVNDGTIPMERINESVHRIVKAKLLHTKS